MHSHDFQGHHYAFKYNSTLDLSIKKIIICKVLSVEYVTNVIWKYFFVRVKPNSGKSKQTNSNFRKYNKQKARVLNT